MRLTVPEKNALLEATQEFKDLATALKFQDHHWFRANRETAAYYVSLALRLDDLRRRLTQEPVEDPLASR